MTTESGRNGRVSLGTTLIAELGKWDVDISAGEIDTSVFGDVWGSTDVGMLGWKGSMSGFCDPTDTTGQDVIYAAMVAGTLINNIRFYIKYSATPGDTVYYFVPDTVSDTNAGMRVTGFKVGQDKSGVATVDISLSASGPILRKSEVIA